MNSLFKVNRIQCISDVLVKMVSGWKWYLMLCIVWNWHVILCLCGFPLDSTVSPEVKNTYPSKVNVQSVPWIKRNEDEDVDLHHYVYVTNKASSSSIQYTYIAFKSTKGMLLSCLSTKPWQRNTHIVCLVKSFDKIIYYPGERCLKIWRFLR